MKVPNFLVKGDISPLSLSRLQNEGSQLNKGDKITPYKSIKATE